MTFSFATIAKLDKNDAIVLVKAHNARQESLFAYIRMNKEKVLACQQAIKLGKSIDLESYGDVLEYGFGDPDKDTRRFMEEEFGFEHRDS